MMAMELYEKQQYFISEENRDLKSETQNMQKISIKQNQQKKQMDEEIKHLQGNCKKAEKENEMLKGESVFKNSLIAEKSQKIDQYATEIHSINRKILDFNVLMESLIQENKKLKIVVSEFEKKDQFVARQNLELQQVTLSDQKIPE